MSSRHHSHRNVVTRTATMVRYLTTSLTPVLICLVILAALRTDWLSVMIAGCLSIVAALLQGFFSYRRNNDSLKLLAATLKSTEESLDGKKAAPPILQPSLIAAFEEVRQQANSLSQNTFDKVSALSSQNRELHQNKQLFEGILGTMIEGVLVLDGAGRILYSNQAARKLLNSQTTIVDNRLFWEVVRTPELQLAIESAIDAEQSFRKEFTLKRTNSVVEVSASRLNLQSNPGLVIVLHNVTELRRLEHMRRDFVSNVSHELKTPLTSIQAYADTLLEGGLEDTKNCPIFVSRILEQADRLQILIQDMLRLAQIESQSDAFECKPVSVAHTIIECVDARVALAEARGITLTVADGDESIETHADPEGLRTIIENLVTNALNYTREGGEVNLRWLNINNQVVIEVQDNGIGIPTEHQERIFERFYRVDTARSRGMGGTGLGLAIVKHLTNLFDGRIEVKSNVGMGTLFRVKLPLATAQNLSEHPAS